MVEKSCGYSFFSRCVVDYNHYYNRVLKVLCRVQLQTMVVVIEATKEGMIVF